MAAARGCHANDEGDIGRASGQLTPPVQGARSRACACSSVCCRALTALTALAKSQGQRPQLED
eukprot:13898588-Alexandrium_andersonii.AAC.1